MKRILVAALIGASVITAAPAVAAQPGDRVTYCEAWSYHPGSDHPDWHLYFETADGDEFDYSRRSFRNLTFVLGERYLVETVVHPGWQQVNGCMIRVVNGKRSAVITTVGGAEWLITHPRIVGGAS